MLPIVCCGSYSPTTPCFRVRTVIFLSFACRNLGQGIHCRVGPRVVAPGRRGQHEALVEERDCLGWDSRCYPLHRKARVARFRRSLMYLHQQDPDNYVACHCLTGKVRCRACGGIGCSLCCMYGGYSRCPDCDGTRSVFRPRHRNRDPGPDPPPPSPSADPFTFDEALAGADDRRNDTIGWLRRSEWFYEDTSGR